MQMCRPGLSVSMKAAREARSASPGPISLTGGSDMYPTDFSLTHALVSDHLDALRREAAQIREVARQPRNAKPPGLLARLRQALARSRQPQARETGAAPR